MITRGGLGAAGCAGKFPGARASGKGTRYNSVST